MSDRYWTGSRSLGGSAKSCLDKQRITTLGLNVDTLKLTRQSELLLLDHRALV